MGLMGKALVVLFILLVVWQPIGGAAPIDRVATAEKVVAITIEDVDTTAEMEEVLRICKETDVKVTFYIKGEALTRLPVAKAKAAGHEFGSQGMSHRFWAEQDSEAIATELALAAVTIQKLTGETPKTVRPPYYYYGDNLTRAVASMSMQPVIIRGIDTGDWLLTTPAAVLEKVKNEVAAGDIININFRAKPAAASLPEVIRELKQRGFNFVRVSELLASTPQRRPVAIRPEFYGVISHLDTTTPCVALTFDDSGPAWKVAEILSILKANGAKGTFFLAGDWAQNNAELVVRISADGHELANHSFSHPRFSWLSAEEMLAEIQATQAILKSQTGIEPQLFRPPYGIYNETLTTILKEKGFSALVLWDIDTRDWSGVSAETIVYRINRDVSPGAIVLFHLHGTNTVDALRDIVPMLQDKGYKLATISEMLGGK
jgi:peptidoglycan/xylan/chitin deacetylase (PgdA/CDA1 family)